MPESKGVKSTFDAYAIFCSRRIYIGLPSKTENSLWHCHKFKHRDQKASTDIIGRPRSLYFFLIGFLYYRLIGGNYNIQACRMGKQKAPAKICKCFISLVIREKFLSGSEQIYLTFLITCCIKTSNQGVVTSIPISNSP